MRTPKSTESFLLRADRTVSTSEVRLRIFAGVALLVTVAIIVVASMSSPFVSWTTLLVLSALVICAEHRDRLFGDQTSASGSIVVAMAAVCAFSNGPWLVGPMVCASLAGAYWPHIRNHAWSRVAVNASSMSLAAGTAATVLHVLGNGPDELGVRSLLSGAAAVLAFWFINSLVLGIAVSTIQNRRLSGVLGGLVRSETELLGFAYGGFLVGFVFVNAPLWIGALALVVLLGTLDLLVVSRSGRASSLLVDAVPAVAAIIVVAALVYLCISEAQLATSAVALTLFGVILVANVAGKRRSEKYFLFAALSAVTSVSVLPAFRGSFFVPLAAAMLASLVPLWRRPTSWSRLSLIAATGFAATGAALTIGVMPSDLLAPLPGSALVGAISGLSALVLWHVVLCSCLMLRAGPGSGLAALGILRDDLAFSVAAGAYGAASGWVGVQVGVAGLAASLLVGLVLVWISDRASGGNKQPVRTRPIDDDDLTDVLRSALLDLPASRLPD